MFHDSFVTPVNVSILSENKIQSMGKFFFSLGYMSVVTIMKNKSYSSNTISYMQGHKRYTALVILPSCMLHGRSNLTGYMTRFQDNKKAEHVKIKKTLASHYTTTTAI